MGFNILDSDGKHIGWTASKFANGSNLQFFDDTQALAPDIDALKANKVTDIKQQASELITATDWQLQRANEREALGIELLESETLNAIMSYREAVRRASNRIEAELASQQDTVVINTTILEVISNDYPVVTN